MPLGECGPFVNLSGKVLKVKGFGERDNENLEQALISMAKLKAFEKKVICTSDHSCQFIEGSFMLNQGQRLAVFPSSHGFRATHPAQTLGPYPGLSTRSLRTTLKASLFLSRNFLFSRSEPSS